MTDDDLGGRIALHDPDALVGAQRQAYRQMMEHTVPAAERAGFVAALPDGRLIGPFNGFLLVPEIAAGFGVWVTAEAQVGGLPEDVRQVVILTVGASWQADYELYAHRAAARGAGLPSAVTDALASGREPVGLSAAATSAHRFTRALVVDHDVPDDVYGSAVAAFGAAGVAAMVHLIGHYLTISALLVAFQVPAPTRTAPDPTVR
jgi:4-carboxymuconolactone decarboxylase